MFVYSIKYKFLAKYDPYWICRLLALRASSVAVVLCLWNAFFFSPNSPGLYFMTIMMGVVATEILPAYNKKQQFFLYWKLIMMIAISTIIFGFISYFHLLALLGVTALTYLYFRVLATNTQTAMVPAIMVMFGIIGIEDANTDLDAAVNSLLFYIEFGLVGSVALFLFPNFRDKTFKSAFLQLLQKDSAAIGKADFSNDNQDILSDLAFMKSQLPYLEQAYTDFYAEVVLYQMALAKQNVDFLAASSPFALMLTELSAAVSAEKIVDKKNVKAALEKNISGDSTHCISNLVDGWNQLCRA